MSLSLDQHEAVIEYFLKNHGDASQTIRSLAELVMALKSELNHAQSRILDLERSVFHDQR